MRTFPYKKVDAFTFGASLGNPAACLYLGEGLELSADEQLAIAKQHKGFVSEVVYCRGSAQSGYHLTYYSSEGEIAFCGHGTIACMYSLIAETPALQGCGELTIRSAQKGELTVYNEIAAQDAVYIRAPEPVHIGTSLTAKAVAGALGLDCACISAAYPIDLIDAGLKTLIVPLTRLADEISVFPELETIRRLCVDHDFDTILLFSLEVANAANIAHTRVFPPKFGYLEDPATGSGNSAFGYYMLKNGLWDGGAVSVEQGGADRVYNLVKLQAPGGEVRFGGKASVRIEGNYRV